MAERDEETRPKRLEAAFDDLMPPPAHDLGQGPGLHEHLGVLGQTLSHNDRVSVSSSVSSLSSRSSCASQAPRPGA
eukprot:CAMPEP_0118854758 /NCGR_PEP_ID=MMETSP1163-20130328/2846_1 /TAXON_ID=124430 /ORGANISM="Phaeomonas parva, Strain CCMP2877" /LENGTH=75 /DNA_ID=CAMNT_0006787529 /DNA_START=635 /DNA_END=858 /DNA_ORIENTATION=+